MVACVTDDSSRLRTTRTPRPREPQEAPYRPGSGGKALREQQLIWYEMFLRSTNSRRGRPYDERTIRDGYMVAASDYHRHLTGEDFGDGFEKTTTGDLNAYLRAYDAGHTPGGTHTKQSNLRKFYEWFEVEYETPNPFKDPRLVMYASPDDEPPMVLNADVITNLIKNCKGNSFIDRRDTAIFRVLLSGVRRSEIADLIVPEVDFKAGLIVVDSRLKHGPPRQVGVGSKTLHAVTRYLMVRPTHRLAETTDALWLGDRGKGPLGPSGVYQMVCRRAVQAGYEKRSIRPHMFRHTKAHDHLGDGGQEGDLERQMGWRPGSRMTRRYGAHLAMQRSVDDSKKRGLDDRY